MKILLDTNAYSALLRGHDEVVVRVRRAREIVLSSVVIGELQFGFRNGTRFDRNMSELEAFLASPFVTVADVSLITADRFARIAAALRRKGTPVPTNDIWIAAHALETGAELLSYDQHFSHIDGLVWTRLTRQET